MKKIAFGVILGVLIVFASSFDTRNEYAHVSSEVKTAADSIADERAKFVAEVMEQIKGKEKMPADSVFKNIKMYKTMSAERLITMMDKGWGNALGVNCTHCHNPKDWSSDDKEDKQLAREMATMTTKINNDLLKKIEGLEKANINCNTCHRGQKKPGGNRAGGSGPGNPPPPKKD